MTEKILGLDIGDKYVGIAVSDALGVTAQGYRTYKKADRNADLAFFGDVVTQFNIKTAVAGLPKDMDGREIAQARKTKNYCNFLGQIRNRSDGSSQRQTAWQNHRRAVDRKSVV